MFLVRHYPSGSCSSSAANAKSKSVGNDNELEEDKADTEFIADSMASRPRHDKIIATKAFVST